MVLFEADINRCRYHLLAGYYRGPLNKAYKWPVYCPQDYIEPFGVRLSIGVR